MDVVRNEDLDTAAVRERLAEIRHRRSTVCGRIGSIETPSTAHAAHNARQAAVVAFCTQISARSTPLERADVLRRLVDRVVVTASGALETHGVIPTTPTDHALRPDRPADPLQGNRPDQQAQGPARPGRPGTGHPGSPRPRAGTCDSRWGPLDPRRAVSEGDPPHYDGRTGPRMGWFRSASRSSSHRRRLRWTLARSRRWSRNTWTSWPIMTSGAPTTKPATSATAATSSGGRP